MSEFFHVHTQNHINVINKECPLAGRRIHCLSKLSVFSVSPLDSSGYINRSNGEVFLVQNSTLKMATCDYTVSLHHGIVPPTGRIYLPVDVTGHIPDYTRLNDRPVIKSCEIALGIRDVCLKVSRTTPMSS